MVPQPAIQKLRSSLRGQSLCPDEPGYDDARTVPNAMINRRPAIIVRCAGAADVVACVRFAREYDVLTSVRGGGHSVAGKSVCEDGLMIDLSGMKGILIDPARCIVLAQAGLTLANLIAKPFSVLPASSYQGSRRQVCSNGFAFGRVYVEQKLEPSDAQDVGNSWVQSG